MGNIGTVLRRLDSLPYEDLLEQSNATTPGPDFGTLSKTKQTEGMDDDISDALARIRPLSGDTSRVRPQTLAQRAV